MDWGGLRKCTASNRAQHRRHNGGWLQLRRHLQLVRDGPGERCAGEFHPRPGARAGVTSVVRVRRLGVTKSRTKTTMTSQLGDDTVVADTEHRLTSKGVWRMDG